MEILMQDYMNKDSKKCFPSQERLSKDLGMSIQTINKHIKSLLQKI